MKLLMSWFTKPLAKDIAKQGLEEAQRQYLKHDSAAMYHAKMLEFYQSNIKALTIYVSKNQ